MDLVAGAVEETGVDEHQAALHGLDAGGEVGGGAALLVHQPDLEGVAVEAEQVLHRVEQAVGEGGDYAPFVLNSHRIWRELEAETGEKLLDDCGVLVMASGSGEALHHGKPDFVARSIEVARDFGIAHEVLDGAEVLDLINGKPLPKLTTGPKPTITAPPDGTVIAPHPSPMPGLVGGESPQPA